MGPFAVIVFCTQIGLLAPASQAASYPVKPIRIMAPFTAGGGIDLIARITGQKLSAGLGQSVIIDNRPGAAGNIGTEVVARAPADGYTLLAVGNIFTVNPIAEAGVPGYETSSWYGILAPAGTPAPIVARLDKELTAILALDDVKKFFLTAGLDMDHRRPTDFTKFIENEMKTWERVVKTANIKVE